MFEDEKEQIPVIAAAGGSNGDDGKRSRFRLAAPLPRNRGGAKSAKVRVGPFPTGIPMRASRIHQGHFAFTCGKKPFLVASHLVEHLGYRVKSALLVAGVDASGRVYLIIIYDSTDSWSASMRGLVERAYDEWIIAESDRSTTSFKGRVCENSFAEPDWTVVSSIDDLVESAFAGRIIESADDPRLGE